jgi:hypothetical protein
VKKEDNPFALEGPGCRNRWKGIAWYKHKELVYAIGQEGTKNPAKWKSEKIQPVRNDYRA